METKEIKNAKRRLQRKIKNMGDEKKKWRERALKAAAEGRNAIGAMCAAQWSYYKEKKRNLESELASFGQDND